MKEETRLKKGTFRMLHRNWWRYCRNQRIKGNELLVLLCLEAGPFGQGHYSGLFDAPISMISNYTGLTPTEISKSLAKLEKRGEIVYDREYQIVYVRGMLERQSPNWDSSDNTINGVYYHVERFPEDSIAVLKFIESKRNHAELGDLLEGYPPT